MEKENDFSKAEQSKFYVPVKDINCLFYLDKGIMQSLNEKCLTTQENLQSLVNGLLRKDIEIAKMVNRRSMPVARICLFTEKTAA